MQIRPATQDDAAAILAIYTPYVETTAISFEETAPDCDEMARRIAANSASHGYFVATQGGAVLGYAYGSTYRPRDAYRFTAEVSVYVGQNVQQRGVGRALYDVLIPHLEKRGFHTLIGIVTQPNPASVKLHEAFGFTHIGTTPQVGRKFEAWYDIGIWQRIP